MAAASRAKQTSARATTLIFAGISIATVAGVPTGSSIAGIGSNFLAGAAAGLNLRLTLGAAVVALADAILLLAVFGHQPVGAATLLLVWGVAFGAIPIALQMWDFKCAPEALEGGAAMLVSTFQIFIALDSVVGGRIVDGLGFSAVMWSGGATALAALLIISLSKHLQAPQSAAPQAEAHLAQKFSVTTPILQLCFTPRATHGSRLRLSGIAFLTRFLDKDSGDGEQLAWVALGSKKSACPVADHRVEHLSG